MSKDPILRITTKPKPALPALQSVTETFAIIARKGSGKTYAGSVVTEEMLDQGAQVVVIDPVGVWHGLRSSADGKSDGYPILILGGEHSDLPLEETAGSVVADFVVDTGASCILDLSSLSKGGMTRFMTAFAEALYHRKAKSREPVHLMIDEADAFAPQKPLPGEQRMVGAMSSLVRRGRARGIGMTLITQRPAVLSKDVLTQLSALVVLRLNGPQDRKAIQDWVRSQDDSETANAMIESLPTLGIGEAWIWSPGWLGVFERVQIRERRTFDSSATPKAGQSSVAKKRAAVDLSKLEGAMAATVEAAKSADPKILRDRLKKSEERVKELEQALVTGGAMLRGMRTALGVPIGKVNEDSPIVTGDVPKGILPKLDAILADVTAIRRDQLAEMRGKPSAAANVEKWKGHDARKPAAAKPAPAPAPAGDDKPKAERIVLQVLAQHGSRTRIQIAILSGYRPTSGGFASTLAKLRADGLIESVGGLFKLTPAGEKEAGPHQPLPTGDDLVDYWKGQLPKAEGQILTTLAMRPKHLFTRDQIAEATGYRPTSGGFASALATLRKLELVETHGGAIGLCKDMLQ